MNPIFISDDDPIYGSLYRLQDGKIVEQWTMGDTLGLLQQLGAVALPMHRGEAPAP
jgi:hypothetical protein